MKEANDIPGVYFEVQREPSEADDSLERMKLEGTYQGFVEFIAARVFSFGDKEQQLVSAIKQRYPWYFKKLSVNRFRLWMQNYPEIAEAYGMGRKELIGRLAYIGYQKAKRTIDNPKDQKTWHQLMNQIDDGTASYNNDKSIIEKRAESGISVQTSNTMNRFFAEAERFYGEELREEDLYEDGDAMLDEEETEV